MPANKYTMIMFGSTGAGKSHTGNTILGKKFFNISSGGSSETKEISFETASYRDCRLTITDTPGFHDTDSDELQALQLVYASFENAFHVNREGVNAFLYCKQYGTRFTAEDEKTLSCFKTTFGARNLKRFGILVLTHGDNFEYDQEDMGLDQTILEWCLSDKKMKTFIPEFDFRVAIFNNRERDRTRQEKQVDALLKLIDEMGSRLYKMEDFQQSSPERAKRILEAKEPEIRKETLDAIDELVDLLGKVKTIRDQDKRNELIEDILRKAKKLLEDVEEKDQGTGVLKEARDNARNIFERAKKEREFWEKVRAKEEVDAHNSMVQGELDAIKAKNAKSKKNWLTALGVTAAIAAVALCPLGGAAVALASTAAEAAAVGTVAAGGAVAGFVASDKCFSEAKKY